jgi:hypothetical protein
MAADTAQVILSMEVGVMVTVVQVVVVDLEAVVTVPTMYTVQAV